MTIGIGIGLRRGAYTPEAYAYSAYLKSKGWQVQLEQEELLDSTLDAHIYFMGIRPFYSRDKKNNPVEIHEYQSLSTPNFAKAKDLAKRILNKKPASRIFLNSVVKEGLRFNDHVPYALRDMGVDSQLFLSAPKKPSFDLVYCGSIGRKGLVEELQRLANFVLKILIAGEVSKEIVDSFLKLPLVKFTGRVERHELPEIYQQARAGLNFTPNIYPFNIQTSTKTLEYCAAGLGVVSNTYEWANSFSSARNANFLWTEKIFCKKDFDQFEFNCVDVSDLEWERLLSRIKLEEFISRTVSIHR